MLFLFSNQMTEYELRIRDWSSDVCSSDLLAIDEQNRRDCERCQQSDNQVRIQPVFLLPLVHHDLQSAHAERDQRKADVVDAQAACLALLLGRELRRTEERSVGEEGDSTCRSRWAAKH